MATFNEHNDVTKGFVWINHDTLISAGKDNTLYHHFMEDSIRPLVAANPMTFDVSVDGSIGLCLRDDLMTANSNTSLQTNSSSAPVFVVHSNKKKSVSFTSSSMTWASGIPTPVTPGGPPFPPSPPASVSSPTGYMTVGHAVQEKFNRLTSIFRPRTDSTSKSSVAAKDSLTLNFGSTAPSIRSSLDEPFRRTLMLTSSTLVKFTPVKSLSMDYFSNFARNYRLSGGDFSEICLFNASVSKSKPVVSKSWIIISQLFYSKNQKKPLTSIIKSEDILLASAAGTTTAVALNPAKILEFRPTGDMMDADENYHEQLTVTDGGGGENVTDAIAASTLANRRKDSASSDREPRGIRTNRRTQSDQTTKDSISGSADLQEHSISSSFGSNISSSYVIMTSIPVGFDPMDAANLSRLPSVSSSLPKSSGIKKQSSSESHDDPWTRVTTPFGSKEPKTDSTNRPVINVTFTHEEQIDEDDEEKSQMKHLLHALGSSSSATSPLTLTSSPDDLTDADFALSEDMNDLQLIHDDDIRTESFLYLETESNFEFTARRKSSSNMGTVSVVAINHHPMDSLLPNGVNQIQLPERILNECIGSKLGCPPKSKLSKLINTSLDDDDSGTSSGEESSIKLKPMISKAETPDDDTRCPSVDSFDASIKRTETPTLLLNKLGPKILKQKPKRVRMSPFSKESQKLIENLLKFHVSIGDVQTAVSIPDCHKFKVVIRLSGRNDGQIQFFLQKE